MRVFGRQDQYQAEDVPFAAGGFGRLYRCNVGRLVYKEYKTPLQDPLKIAQLERTHKIGREVIAIIDRFDPSTAEAAMSLAHRGPAQT